MRCSEGKSLEKENTDERMVKVSCVASLQSSPLHHGTTTQLHGCNEHRLPERTPVWWKHTQGRNRGKYNRGPTTPNCLTDATLRSSVLSCCLLSTLLLYTPIVFPPYSIFLPSRARRLSTRSTRGSRFTGHSITPLLLLALARQARLSPLNTLHLGWQVHHGPQQH